MVLLLLGSMLHLIPAVLAIQQRNVLLLLEAAGRSTQ
jgi:hypothetical protein